MAFTTADGSTGVFVNGYPSGNRNDGGGLSRGGTIASSRFDSLVLKTDTPVTVVSGINNKPSSVGTWNNGASNTIMRVTSLIAGIPSTSMTSASSKASSRDSILQAAVIKVRLYKTGIKAGNWNEFTGKWSSDPAVVYSGGWNNASSVDNAATLKASGTDVAANPTQSDPGRLTFSVGSGNVPSTQSYATRYLW